MTTCPCREALERIISYREQSLALYGHDRQPGEDFAAIAREALAEPCGCKDERQRLQRQLSEIVRNAAALRRQRDEVLEALLRERGADA
jgi:hypothetical protein